MSDFANVFPGHSFRHPLAHTNNRSHAGLNASLMNASFNVHFHCSYVTINMSPLITLKSINTRRDLISPHELSPHEVLKITCNCCRTFVGFIL